MDDQFTLQDQRILVAGGTRGIGRAISLQLARAGARVLANFVRGEDQAASLRAECQAAGLQVEVCRADLTGKSGLQHLVDTMERLDWNGRLNGLVFCAATGVHKELGNLTVRHFDWTFGLNVRAFFELTTLLLGQFDSQGSIVAVSSLGARRTAPAYSLVGASKGALESLARHMATELGSHGLRVNIVCPGTVETEAWKAMPQAAERLAMARAKTALGHLVSPEEVAACVQFLCSAAASGITGSTLVVDAGESLPI
jgi:enoyl-[acyl-carrier protein] reductase III